MPFGLVGRSGDLSHRASKAPATKTRCMSRTKAEPSLCLFYNYSSRPTVFRKADENRAYLFGGACPRDGREYQHTKSAEKGQTLPESRTNPPPLHRFDQVCAEQRMFQRLQSLRRKGGRGADC